MFNPIERDRIERDRFERYREDRKAEAFANLEQYLQQDHSINWSEVYHEFNLQLDNAPSPRDVLTALTKRGSWNQDYVHSLYLYLYHNQSHAVLATNEIMKYQGEYLRECEFCTNVGDRAPGCQARGCYDKHRSCGPEHTQWIHNRHLVATCLIEGCLNRAFECYGVYCKTCAEYSPSCSTHADQIKRMHLERHVAMGPDISESICRMPTLNLEPGHRASERNYLRKCREEKERSEKASRSQSVPVVPISNRNNGPAQLALASYVGPVPVIKKQDDIDDIVKQLLNMGNDNNTVMMALGILYTGEREITTSNMLLEISKLLVEKNREKKSSPKRSDAECSICMVEPPQTVILECGHQCVCLNCINSLETCPLCRGEITRWVKVYRN